MPRSSDRALRFWGVVLPVVLLDIVTKYLAVDFLMPQRMPHDVIGEAVRLTLVYNPGAAFGLNVGPASRWVFMVLTIGALFILRRLYLATRPGETLRLTSVALVCAGAIGNLIDRIRSPLGVVDFIDVGIGAHRWPTFNVADIAVSTGAFLLAWVLWHEDSREAAATSLAGPASPTGPAAAGDATTPLPQKPR